MDLKFVCDLLKEVDPYAPSISQVKNTTLSTFITPQKARILVIMA